MSKARMEAFSDGVLAIIITIMVLEMEVPHGAELTALRPLIPVFLSYGLSFAPAPTAVYGVILLLAAIAYLLLQHAILRQEGPDSTLGAAVGRDRKGKVSPLIYAIAIPVAFLHPWMAGALYVVGALMWLVPDRRIERKVSQAGPEVSMVEEA
jgi:uncharacterized membrane protein